ncbi:helix-turn-helix transcriptional regulator [Microbacterium oleivorans]|uniref:helix-turn-helix transcriptional regulator n=1 Tax=Microbacterium TaxID=33882 RepID=UPI0033E2836F
MRNDLRERRAAAGLSQERLADLLGVSRQTVISIERDRFDPSLDLAFRIAATFDARIEEVFFPSPAS